jgi:hypothetical protein
MDRNATAPDPPSAPHARRLHGAAHAAFRTPPAATRRTGAKAPQISGDLYAGEALDAVAACYIKASDGLVVHVQRHRRQRGRAVHGVHALVLTQADQPVTALPSSGARFRYGIGHHDRRHSYFVAATAGRLDTAATTGGLVAVAEVDHRDGHPDHRHARGRLTGELTHENRYI